MKLPLIVQGAIKSAKEFGAEQLDAKMENARKGLIQERFARASLRAIAVTKFVTKLGTVKWQNVPTEFVDFKVSNKVKQDLRLSLKCSA